LKTIIAKRAPTNKMKHGGGERSKGQEGKDKVVAYPKPLESTFHVDARPGAAAC